MVMVNGYDVTFFLPSKTEKGRESLPFISMAVCKSRESIEYQGTPQYHNSGSSES
jgi:hypothetical protein